MVAPTPLNAKVHGPKSIALTWVDRNNKEQNYAVERRLGFAADFEEIVLLPKNSTVWPIPDQLYSIS